MVMAGLLFQSNRTELRVTSARGPNFGIKTYIDRKACASCKDRARKGSLLAYVYEMLGPAALHCSAGMDRRTFVHTLITYYLPLLHGYSPSEAARKLAAEA